MSVPDGDPADIVRAVFHEMRSRVGVVRLAVTTLQQSALDADLDLDLLRTADRETLRLSADMVGAGALVHSYLDRSSRAAIEVGGVLRRAASRARQRGVMARSRGGRELYVRARGPSLEAVLSALMQLVADGDGEAVATAATDRGKVVVRIASSVAGSVPPTSVLARSLVQSVGGTVVPSEHGVAFHLPGARP